MVHFSFPNDWAQVKLLADSNATELNSVLRLVKASNLLSSTVVLDPRASVLCSSLNEDGLLARP